MKTIEYNFIDKSTWPFHGPWDNEPDKIQWLDKETRFPCLIVRNPHLGALYGYVGVDKNHPAFGRDYNDIDVSVHGGLIYSTFCQETEHGICHLVEEGEDDNTYWLGFDCAHFGDYSPSLTMFDSIGEYRTIDYVKNEVANLAKQLKNYVPR
jgi:hypothetical protein